MKGLSLGGTLKISQVLWIITSMGVLKAPRCLIELLDVFFKDTDKPNTVGILVVKDFSKALDCIDHIFAIQKLCDLGVRSEIIPWIADFLESE